MTSQDPELQPGYLHHVQVTLNGKESMALAASLGTTIDMLKVFGGDPEDIEIFFSMYNKMLPVHARRWSPDEVAVFIQTLRHDGDVPRGA